MALTKSKAKKILRDGKAHGKPLTEKQKMFFRRQLQSSSNTLVERRSRRAR